MDWQGGQNLLVLIGESGHFADGYLTTAYTNCARDGYDSV
jgi:hypothetical protein